uniref:Uncharacterized protein n=1 Tax=Romanomermis culicivorax TaxID=13658 RepID=A0A915K5N8_ROMCU
MYSLHIALQHLYSAVKIVKSIGNLKNQAIASQATLPNIKTVFVVWIIDQFRFVIVDDRFFFVINDTFLFYIPKHRENNYTRHSLKSRRSLTDDCWKLESDGRIHLSDKNQCRKDKCRPEPFFHYYLPDARYQSDFVYLKIYDRQKNLFRRQILANRRSPEV